MWHFEHAISQERGELRWHTGWHRPCRGLCKLLKVATLHLRCRYVLRVGLRHDRLFKGQLLWLPASQIEIYAWVHPAVIPCALGFESCLSGYGNARERMARRLP